MNKILQTATFLSLVLGAAILTSDAEEARSSVTASQQVADETGALEFRLGMDYYQKQQYSQALKYFRQAAGRGDVQAIIQLGLMYDFGQGVYQNYSEAMRWYLRAAEKGQSRAMYLVGHMHEFGEGVPIDIGEAFDWYLKSARHGHASAQFEIGKTLTRSGRDTLRYQEGIKWLQLAADQCHTQAVELLQTVSNQPFDASFCNGG